MSLAGFKGGTTIGPVGVSFAGDSIDAPSNGSGNLTVNPASPTINWTPPAITYGTALSSTQLDATASFNGATVAGTYVYSPASGKVLALVRRRSP